MNNAITEIKKTLERTNFRVTKMEERISEWEDRMMEMSEASRKENKRINRTEDNLTSGAMLNTPTFES